MFGNFYITNGGLDVSGGFDALMASILYVDNADSSEDIKQGPWLEHGHLRRNFEYQIEYLDTLSKQLTANRRFRPRLTGLHPGRLRQAIVEDHQMVEVANEHLLYVVSDRKTPWHLPHRDSFLLLTKVYVLFGVVLPSGLWLEFRETILGGQATPLVPHDMSLYS